MNRYKKASACCRGSIYNGSGRGIRTPDLVVNSHPHILKVYVHKSLYVNQLTKHIIFAGISRVPHLCQSWQIKNSFLVKKVNRLISIVLLIIILLQKRFKIEQVTLNEPEISIQISKL